MKKKVTAILVNDTSFQAHHGCHLVIDNLCALSSQHGIEIIKTVPVESSLNDVVNILEHNHTVNIVIVNGEGTIHHSNQRALELVKVASYCHQNGIPCVLINAVYQENNEEILSHVKKFLLIYVREKNSQDELAKYGVQSQVVPDLTLSMGSIKNNYIRCGVLINDHVKKQIGRRLFSLQKKIPNSRFISLIAQPKLQKTKNNAHYFLVSNVDIMKYWLLRVIGSVLYCIPFVKKHLSWKLIKYRYSCAKRKQFLSRMSQSEILITGRFHAVCMALITKTPFITLSSNTFKIEGLLNELAMENRIINQTDDMLIIDESIKQFSTQELVVIDRYLSDAHLKTCAMYDSIVALVQNNNRVDS